MTSIHPDQVNERVRRYLRRRALGAAVRSGRYARQVAWRGQALPFIRHAWPLLVFLPPGLVLALLPLELRLHGIGRDLLLGGTVASGVWVDVLFVVVLSGAGTTFMGAVGESWTAQGLRWLCRQGWLLVNGFKLDPSWDIDHVLVGPNGVLSIESKWSGDPWPLRDGDRVMQDRRESATRQARRNADDLSDWLTRAGLEVPVTSVVVLWSGTPTTEAGWVERGHGRSVIVHGPDLRGWLRSELPKVGAIAAETVDRIYALLAQHVAEHEMADVQAGLTPVPTLVGLFGDWVMKPVLGVTGAVYAMRFTSVAHDWRIELGSDLVAIVLGMLALRWSAIRRLALGWIAASALFVVADLGLVLASVLGWN
jgi:hypothetical protein